MKALTDTLQFNEQLPLEGQVKEVQQFVHQLLATTPPTQVDSEQCSGTLWRPLRETWRTGEAEILRVYEYATPATAAACFSLRGCQLILRSCLC